MSELQPWQSALASCKKKFEATNIEKHVNYDKEVMFALQVVTNNPYLMDIANKNPNSLRNAIINTASIGLSLNPATQYAYLVPRDGVCVLDISYKGLIKIATDTGSIMWAKADLVYANDKFEYLGPAEKPNHSANVFGDRGEFIGVYCIAKTCDGDILSDIMKADEIYQVRNKSKAYVKASSQGKTNSVWHEWFGEMAKKTIIKRASKTWPKTDRSDRLGTAIEVINQHEGIDFDKRICGVPMKDIVDVDSVDEVKVQGFVNMVVKIIENDDEDAGVDAYEEIYRDMNNAETIVFEKLLSGHKHGRKTYKTLFKEYGELPLMIDQDIPQ